MPDWAMAAASGHGEPTVLASLDQEGLIELLGSEVLPRMRQLG